MMDELKVFLNSINKNIEHLSHLVVTGELLNEGELATGYTVRGVLHSQLNMFDESMADFSKSIAIMERIRDKDKKQISEYELAKAYAGRGIEIFEGLLEPESGGLIDIDILFKLYIMRGGVLNHIYGSMDEALVDYHKGIRLAGYIEKAEEPVDKNGLATIYMGVGQSYDQKEEFVEANIYYDKCIEIWECLQKGEHLLTDEDENNLATAYMNRGSNHRCLGDNDRCLIDYNKCINIRERFQEESIEQNPFDVFMAYKNRAMVYKANRDMKAVINDEVAALRTLKVCFNECPEFQEIYYRSLFDAIGAIANENDNIFLASVIKEFLYSMLPVNKTKAAKEAQDEILRWLDDHGFIRR